jgi:hypothetical protein
VGLAAGHGIAIAMLLLLKQILAAYKTGGTMYSTVCFITADYF